MVIRKAKNKAIILSNVSTFKSQNDEEWYKATGEIYDTGLSLTLLKLMKDGKIQYKKHNKKTDKYSVINLEEGNQNALICNLTANDGRLKSYTNKQGNVIKSFSVYYPFDLTLNELLEIEEI